MKIRMHGREQQARQYRSPDLYIYATPKKVRYPAKIVCKDCGWNRLVKNSGDKHSAVIWHNEKDCPVRRFQSTVEPRRKRFTKRRTLKEINANRARLSG